MADGQHRPPPGGTSSFIFADDLVKDTAVSEMPSGSIEAFELGNEPDHYPKRKMRPDPYGYPGYIQDWDAILLPSALVQTVGPSALTCHHTL